MGKYIFAGASSAIANAAQQLLAAAGHEVVGISTKPDNGQYATWHQVNAYHEGDCPAIEGPVAGIAYFPGTINLKPFHRLTPAEMTIDFQINALGAARFVQAYLPQLKAVPGASVVFISTVAVGAGMPFHASVAMAKGAVESLTRALAAELAPGIRVNCVAPSLTASTLSEKLLNTPEKMENAQKRNPLRKVGTPEEVAEAVQFLLTPASQWITGQVIAVDGGMSTVRI